MQRTGILLVNLGSPAAPTPKAVRHYLKEFLSDKRVVDLPRALWLPILHGIILNTRPKKVAKAYQSIWGKGKSLLTLDCEKVPDTNSRSTLVETCEAIRQQLKLDMPVALAMRYGCPCIDQALTQLMATPIDKLIILPLFPQYSSATTASVFDAVSDYFKDKRSLPELHFIRDYHDHPLYIEALAHSVRDHWQQHGQGQQLLISFHGMPQRYIDTGDIYHDQCTRSADLLATALSLKPDQWQMVFQSRFGREPWLQPYFDDTIKKLPQQGIQQIDVISPGFSADCLETLEELAIAGKEDFLGAGGTAYHYIPALNTNPRHTTLLQELIQAQLS